MALGPECEVLLEKLIRTWVADLVAAIDDVKRRAVAELAASQAETKPKLLADRGTLSTPEAADYVGLSRSTLEKLRLTGGGPRYVKLGRRVGYRIEALESWIGEREFPNTSAADEARNTRPSTR